MWAKLLGTVLLSGMVGLGMASDAVASKFGPLQGKVLDAETREPVEGVVVLIEWRLIHFFAGSTFYDAQETLTDKNGDFYIPGMWTVSPIAWLKAEAHLILYKSGYRGLHSMWEVVVEDLEQWKYPREKGESYVSNVEEGKPVIMLKKLTIEERKRFSTPGTGDIPHEKKKLLMQEINKERKFFGLGAATD